MVKVDNVCANLYDKRPNSNKSYCATFFSKSNFVKTRGSVLLKLNNASLSMKKKQ